jgi:ketosteroid isomerase-like protein
MDPVALVEQFLDAFARHDLDGMLALLAVDAYFVPTGQDFAPGYGDFSGHEGWRDWWTASHGDELSLDRLEIERLDTDRVLAELLIGAPTKAGWLSVVRVGVYTIRDGTIAAVEVFNNRDVAYERVRAARGGS